MRDRDIRYLAWKVAQLLREQGYEPNVKVWSDGELKQV